MDKLDRLKIQLNQHMKAVNSFKYFMTTLYPGGIKKAVAVYSSGKSEVITSDKKDFEKCEKFFNDKFNTIPGEYTALCLYGFSEGEEHTTIIVDDIPKEY